MKRMKTFLVYVLLIVGFFFFSVLAERGLIEQMYVPMSGETNGSLVLSSDSSTNDLKIEVEEAVATSRNGRITLLITNTSGHYIEKCAAKIDLLSKRNVVVATDYIELNKFEVNETRRVPIVFTATDVASYRVTLQEKAPYKDPNIVNIFGWDVDLKDVFGLDLTKYKDMIDGEAIKNGLSYRWSIAVNFAKSLPTWVYVVATGIVIWHLPKGFLLGIFPF